MISSRQSASAASAAERGPQAAPKADAAPRQAPTPYERLPDDLPVIEVPLEDRLEHAAAFESRTVKRKEVLVDAKTQRVVRPKLKLGLKLMPRTHHSGRVLREVWLGTAGGVALGAVVYLAALMLVP
jgi:hypothetical protein